MKSQPLGNYLRVHRRKIGLSQRELGLLLGYRNAWQVSRHERSKSAPPLLTALAYEAVFQVPVSAIFAGMNVPVLAVVEKELKTLEERLKAATPKGANARVAAQKLKWLEARKTG
jgi:DNA-binding XRE family transcriptional regulator